MEVIYSLLSRMSRMYTTMTKTTLQVVIVVTPQLVQIQSDCHQVVLVREGLTERAELQHDRENEEDMTLS
jgi:hypothetical protein